jgi:toxin ParE1/3/4
MPNFRLAERARRDLSDIYARTEIQFGRHQADVYNAGFFKCFDLIASFPHIGRSADNLKSGHRRYRHKSHYIFYTIKPDHVLIEAIFHAAQNLRSELFD